FSHLLLDEICSVDLKGARVNNAFGTAIKFWAPSPWTTLGMYALLSYLSWRVIEQWPGGPDALMAGLPAPRLPLPIPPPRHVLPLTRSPRRPHRCGGRAGAVDSRGGIGRSSYNQSTRPDPGRQPHRVSSRPSPAMSFPQCACRFHPAC